MKKWRKIKTLEIYDCGGHYYVSKDRVLTPGGQETDYYVTHKPPGILVIPIDIEGYIYFTKQHRYTIDMISLEVVGGAIDIKKPSEKEIIKAAKRELGEECRLSCESMKKVGFYYIGNGILNTIQHIFVASNCKIDKNLPKDPLDKNLHETHKYKWSEVKDLIAKGDITDSCTLSGLMIAEQKGVFENL